MGGSFKLRSMFLDGQKVLSFSRLCSFVCCIVTVLSAIKVKCNFLFSGEMSFTEYDCFGADLFFSWLIAPQAEFCLEDTSSLRVFSLFFFFFFLLSAFKN